MFLLMNELDALYAAAELEQATHEQEEWRAQILKVEE